MISKRHVGITTLLFVIVGIGLGASGYIIVDYAGVAFGGEDQGQIAQAISGLFIGLVVLQTTFVTFLLGSIVAMVTGILAATHSTRRQAALSNGLGALVGFPLMVLFSVVLMLLGVPDLGSAGGVSTPTPQFGTPAATPTPTPGGGGLDTGPLDVVELLGRVVALTVPTTTVAVATAAVLHPGGD